MTLDSLLRPSEVARRLAVKPVTVYAWIRGGRLPAIRLGKHCVRVRERDMEAFISGALAASISSRSQSVDGLRGERLPERLHRLFWDTDPAAVDVGAHAKQIIERILEFGDEADTAWAVRTYGRGRLLEVARGSKTLTRKSAVFWQWVLPA